MVFRRQFPFIHSVYTMALPSDTHTSYTSADHSGKNYTLTLAVVMSLFFLWAMGGKMNDILIPHLRKALTLTDLQSSLVQTAFFGAYFFMAIPAGLIMKKVGYKNGIIIALAFCTAGALLFYPAASTLQFPFFLGALFVLASGFAMLEVAVNPYVSILGSPATAASRLNLAQAFNSLGATITPYIGAQVIFSGIEKSESELASMTKDAMMAYQIFEADRVKGPYLIMALIFVVIAVVIFFSNLPEIKTENSSSTSGSKNLFGVFRFPQLSMGVLGIFLYVGAQEGIAAFIIRFMQHLEIEGVNEKMAANYLVLYWFTFMIGRFSGAYIISKFKPNHVLAFFATLCVVLVLMAVFTQGMFAVWCIVAVGFFNSIQFPTIFTLSLQGLGDRTKDGATFLVMSIVGAAIIPLLVGYVSTISNIQWAFLIPAVCYAYVVYYAISVQKTAAIAS